MLKIRRTLLNALETRKIQAKARPRGKEGKKNARTYRGNCARTDDTTYVERKYCVPQDRGTLVMCTHVVYKTDY